MQNKFKNLQVLEFESRKELNKYMKSISKDLGVKCSHCHDLNDKSIDIHHKLIAREMIIMQKDLNKKYFGINVDSVLNKTNFAPISCWTCHRGETIPQFIRKID